MGVAMRRRSTLLTVSVLVLVLLAGTGDAQILQSQLRPPEVLRACGDATSLVTFNLLAQSVAPVLWFSPDEPLITSANREINEVGIPRELPFGANAMRSEANPRSRVYYRISRLRVLDNATSQDKHSFEALPGMGKRVVPFEKASYLHVRYLLYYPEDIGFGQHAHDIEVVEVELAIVSEVTEKGQCYSVRVARIAGAAHGSDWYTNVLDVGSDVDDLVLPPHILVEEGKHASAPDRNADGWFTPGYDATLNANDAWGVRDTLRERRIGGRLYSPAQAKDRCSNPQISISRQHRQLRDPLISHMN